ncbi:hypothetical protein K4K52_002606 [Colletotrichum sp. SAR 10_76]|nr:hypothetical protein K4K52_002606 [Colletotrichum sp. SAR 10_76]
MDPQGIILDDDAGRFVSGDETTCDLCNLLSNAALSCSIPESEAQGFELRAFSYLQNGISVRHTLPGAQDSLLVVVTAKNMVIFDETFFDDYGYNGKSYVVLTDDQGNAAELSDQINKMDLIYSNAEATIVAAAGPDETYGLPGVGSTKRFKQDIVDVAGAAMINMGPHPAVYVEEESRWWKRGWTFQEGLLSRRRIIFTETQAFFECNTASWIESLGGIELVKDRQSLNWTKWKNGTFLLSHFMGQPETQAPTETTTHGGNELLENPAGDSRIARRLVDFFRLIQQYTTRSLTYDSDSLNAAAGMLKILAKRKPSVLAISGLPYVSLPAQDVLIDTQIFIAISWLHLSRTCRFNVATMKPLVCIQALLLLLVSSAAQIINLKPVPNSILLATTLHPPVILLSSNETAAVKRAAASLSIDFGRVLGKNSTIVYDTFNTSTTFPVLVIGTLGYSPLLKLQNSSIQGEWESYTHEVITNPFPGISSALSVVGSDKRGTVYGIYALSEQIGVSPWYFWADVPVAPSTSLHLSLAGTIHTQGPPSVKYRGIFINDEETCLTSWARTRFPLASSDRNRPFTSSFYAHVFELILRLKGNYLWPAMKNSMFYVDDVANGALADDFGVVMGTSHHEPMARAYREQERDLDGRWDWSLNKENLTAFMRAGAERSKDWETVYTMGMRGEGDTESPTLTAPQLEEIIAVQQEILNATHGSRSSDLPKVWALYKEVGKYYQQGLQVPDDVTLLWTDDNYGNLLRTPYPNETSRTGGAGVYYHVNYVGRPKIYEWINTIQLAKTWEQMHLAYEKGAREVWIVNVGDIKPLEIPTTHFLDMAYDMSLHLTPTSTTTWLEIWTSKTFSPDIASAVADILNRYGRLVNRRKYETLNMPPFVYSTLFYNEASTALEEWETLLEDTLRVYEGLGETWRDAFYQMVSHPVEAGKTVNELYIKAEMAKLYQAQRRTATNRLATEAKAAFARDKEISAEYNGINGDMDEARVNIEVDWSSAPKGHSTAALTVQRNDTEDAVTVLLPIFNPPVAKEDLVGRWIESGGVVSIEAAHYSSIETINGVSYVELPFYGKTHSGVKLWPVGVESLTQSTAPKLRYDFFTFAEYQDVKMLSEGIGMKGQAYFNSLRGVLKTVEQPLWLK